MTREDEIRLIAAVKRGDGSAFERLVTENEKLVYSLAFKMTGSREDAMDLSQEAFLRAYSNINSFRGGSRFSVWLYRLTYNICADFLRRKRPDAVSLVNEEGETLDVTDDAPGPDEQAEAKERREAVRRAVASLPEDKRQVIVMREFSGMDYAEIAEALGISVGTVKSRLSRARESLAEILRTDGTFSDLGPSNPLETKNGKGGGPND